MTTTSVLSLFNSILKFDGTNWVSFKKDAKVYFRLEGNWGIISGDTIRPEALKRAKIVTHQTREGIHFSISSSSPNSVP
jgi:hypothetical protein